MKVFVVIAQYNYDFEVDICTDVFSTREKAESFWKRAIKVALSTAKDALNEDEIIIEKDDRTLWFDVYLDGRASEWESQIWVEEKEVDEI